MLEGLPPNNAAHLAARDDRRFERARKIADLIVESFEPAEAAATAFETEVLWPGGGKAWIVEVYFGFAPDEEGIRELVAAAAGEEAAALLDFGLTVNATGSPMRSPASSPSGPGASSSMARTTATR